MADELEANPLPARHAAAGLRSAAGDPGALQAAIATLRLSIPADDALLVSAARVAVREATDTESLRLLLIGLTTALTPQFGGEASAALGALIEARDPAVAAHHRAVEAAAVRLAQRLQFEPETVTRVAQAARFFDVGKLFVPREILYAEGPLDRESWPLVKRHVFDGWAIANSVPALAHLSGIVRSHHERVDGHGYPDGRDARSLPIEVGVLSLADAWVSVVSSRPFRAPMTIREAVLMLEDGRGSQWPAESVDALLTFVLPRKLKRGSVPGARQGVRAAGVRARRF
jgi:response regulator RpfG family c-di-GMP phosphodiesterase